MSGLLGCLLLTTPALAQAVRSLESVTVFGKLTDKYTVGMKVMSIDSTTLFDLKGETLSELISQSSAIATKQYGFGRLTTLAFRGTSPTHTAVLWNGININQPTLGQTDLSTIAVGSYDNVSLHYGAASSNYGSDAIGGSILLNSQPRWLTKPSLALSAQLSSFLNRSMQAHFRTGQVSRNRKSQWESATTAYLHSWLNHFPADSIKQYPIGRTVIARRGLTQDFFWNNQAKHLWALHAWVSTASYNIEPDHANTHQHDRSIRLLSSFQAGAISLKTGYIQERIVYQATSSNVDRWFSRTEYEWARSLQKSARMSVRVGMELNYYRAIVDGYNGNKIREWRSDAFVLSRWKACDLLSVSLNLRQGMLANQLMPISPTLGTDWKWLNRAKVHASWQASVARSYHQPTLNERYWVPQGNPHLLPEKGWAAESSLTLQYAPNASVSAKFIGTVFRKRVSNWIIWNPEANYKAQNLQEVLSTGFEAFTQLKFIKNEHSFDMTTHYSFTRVSYQKGASAFDRDIIGKQLVFVPLHLFSMRLRWTSRSTSVLLNTRYQGWSYSNADNTKLIPDAWVPDLLINQKVRYKKTPLWLGFRVLNLLNTPIIGVENRALGQRQLVLSTHFQF